jgi:DnaJ-domain-containing protein 1
MVAAQKKKNVKKGKKSQVKKNVLYRTGKKVRYPTAKKYQAAMKAWCKEPKNKGKLEEFEDEIFDVVYENYAKTSGTYKVALKLFQQKRKENREAENREAEDEDDSDDYAESDSEEEYEEASDYEGEDDDSDGEDDDSDGKADNMKALKDTNLYTQLGVATSATTVEIKKAFRALAKKHHPDKGGDEEVFKRVNAAYEVLSNTQKREVYDTFCR